jgi:hypothetical protein
VAQGSCGTFSASLAPGSIVPPITIDVTKTDLPSDAQPTGGGTTQDGAVTFSVCPTLNDAVGTYHVQLTSSGSVPADDFIDGMNVSITACQPIPEPTLCSSGAYAACGSFGDGCGGTVLCPACAAGSGW